MLKKVVHIFLICVLTLSVSIVLFLVEPRIVEHKLSATAIVESVDIREGSCDEQIIPNEEKHIKNFMRVSGLSKLKTMDIVNNPEKYLYILCTVKIENKGDTELLLIEPSIDMFKDNDIWLLSEIEGYQKISPKTIARTNVFLVAKNTDDNKNFRMPIPITMEYSEQIDFKQIKNTLIVFTEYKNTGDDSPSSPEE